MADNISDKPGEIIVPDDIITLNATKATISIIVENTADRPIQVGSHVHFPQANRGLHFDREKTIGYRLNIPAGTAVRFEPGISKEVNLVKLRDNYVIPGLTIGSDYKK